MLGTQTLATLIAVHGLLMAIAFFTSTVRNSRRWNRNPAGCRGNRALCVPPPSDPPARPHPQPTIRRWCWCAARHASGTNAELQLIARPDLAMVGIEMSLQGALDGCRIVCWAVFDVWRSTSRFTSLSVQSISDADCGEISTILPGHQFLVSTMR